MVGRFWQATKNGSFTGAEALSFSDKASGVFVAQKRWLAFDSRWSQKILKMTEKVQTYQKKPGGRPKTLIKREAGTGVRFTKSEYFIVKQKAQRAGLKISSYIRTMAIEGQVLARLSAEEKQWLRQLAGMANNINQMAKKANQEGLLKALFFFEKTRAALDDFLNRLHHDQ